MALKFVFEYYNLVYNIGQGVMSRTPSEYPSHSTHTALMSTMAAIQSTALALGVERDWSQWKLGWNLRLVAVIYSVHFSSFYFLLFIGLNSVA